MDTLGTYEDGTGVRRKVRGVCLVTGNGICYLPLTAAALAEMTVKVATGLEDKVLKVDAGLDGETKRLQAGWQWSSNSGGIVVATDVTVLAAAATAKHYVSSIQLRSTSLIATEFVIKSGATVLWRTQLAAGQGLTSIEFATPLRGAINSALSVQCLTAAANVFVNLQGFTI